MPIIYKSNQYLSDELPEGDGFYHVIYDASELVEGVSIDAINNAIDNSIRQLRSSRKGTNSYIDRVSNTGTVEFIFWYDFYETINPLTNMLDQHYLDKIVRAEERGNFMSPRITIENKFIC